MKEQVSTKNGLLLKAWICLIAFALLLGGVIYLAVRPISYNMEYYGEIDDEYGFFAGRRYYTREGYEIIKNTNYDLPGVGFYYYKDGYVFSLRSETEEQVALETEKINNRWEDALKVDFYACEINAFRLISIRPDGAVTVYLCKDAIILTAVSTAASLAAAGLSCAYLVRYRKAKKEDALPTEKSGDSPE